MDKRRLLWMMALFCAAWVQARQMGPKVMVTADQVAAAISSSPLGAAFQHYAADIGRLAMFESGGNLGIYNGSCCTGVLQMTKSNIDHYCHCKPEQYANLPLQQQVNYWAELTNDNGNNATVRRLMSMGSFGGQQVDGAMILSCIQIGPGNCAKTLAAGTCATQAGADGNGYNFCDFAARVRAIGGANPGTNPGTDPGAAPIQNPVPLPDSGGSQPQWTPVSAGEAFYAGAGVDMSQVRDLVAEAIALALLFWTAWVAQAHFFSWRRGRINALALQSNVVTALVLTMLILFFMLD